jgi:hypothetical protein
MLLPLSSCSPKFPSHQGRRRDYEETMVKSYDLERTGTYVLENWESTWMFVIWLHCALATILVHCAHFHLSIWHTVRGRA